MPKPMKPILSLDGGGIRGIFTAAFLAHVEEHLDCRIVDHVGLITGTSTGSLIGLGLAAGYSAQEILEAYKEGAPKIFPSKKWYSPRGWIGPKHDNEELTKWVKDMFGDKVLGDSPVSLAIPTIDTETGSPRVWKTGHHPRLHVGKKTKMWEVALSSSAAPTYLPAVQVEGLGAYVDGGLWANNPSMVGIIEAKSFLGQPFESIRLLSIGTGKRKTWFRFENIRDKGRLGWVKSIVELILFVSSEATENQVEHLLESEQYLRINEDLPNKMELDDISSIGQLENLGRKVGMKSLEKVEHFLIRLEEGEQTPR